MNQYKYWRNRVKNLIQNSKTKFYSESINNNYRNPKQLWQTLHDITGKADKSQTSFINDKDGNPILDPEDAANAFNNYFTSMFKALIPQTSISNENLDTQNLSAHLQNKLLNTEEFTISPVHESFVLKELQNLKVNKASGVDDLSAKYLKISAQVISKPLTSILNLSIQNSSYPDALKKAKVTPVFKKGCKSDINNYRPISVLPIINSIFERHVSTCMISYLEKNNLLFQYQSGFRRLHSCQTALTKIVDNWLNALNNKETVGTVFLDLSKAFDLVNHKLLLQKLAMYGFSQKAILWFDSYLTNRTQQVYISGKLSESNTISIGVPQGSVLGPLLFLVYINDLPLSISSCVLDLFADDATLSSSDPSVLSLTNRLNADLENFQDWCKKNKMVLNIPKTKAMFISSRNAANRIMENPPDLKISNETIQLSSNEKLLGVNIDNTLSWTFQVENTVKKCNSLLYLLNRIKCYLTIPVRKLFYNAYILPHLDYCCTIWGNINNNLTDTLVKFQKRAARIILDRSIDTPSADLFAELNWMTFPERVKYQKAVLMFKIMNNLTPSYLNNLYSYTSDIHQRSLRSTTDNLLYVPKPKTEIFRNSFSYSGSMMWNAIPESVKQSSSVAMFKAKYLQWANAQT